MLDPSLREQIHARLRAGGFATHLGFELADLEPGRSEVRLTIEPHHLNPGGIAHGGVAAALLDSAIGLALRTLLPADGTHATLQLQVTYLRPVSAGTVIARGRAVHSGARIEFGDGTLTDEQGQLLAHGTATFVTRQAR